MTDASHVGEARRFAAQITQELGFSEKRASNVAIIVNELGTNLSRHADNGKLILQVAGANQIKAIQLISLDSGPGIDDLEHSMKDGVTTSTTSGIGLGAIKRLSDEFDIDSSPSGTLLYSSVYAADPTERLPDTYFTTAAICIPVGVETVCGDSWCEIRNGDNVLLMVVDGLGHGPLAHKAAAEAVSAFQGMDASLPLDVILQRLHGLLRSTRGGSVSLARWVPGKDSVEYLGIGNVRTMIEDFAKERSLLNHPGTIGLQYRPKPIQTVPWTGHGYLVLHSDGILTRWTMQDLKPLEDKHPALIAAKIYRDYLRGNDDATVLVAGFVNR